MDNDGRDRKRKFFNLFIQNVLFFSLNRFGTLFSIHTIFTYIHTYFLYAGTSPPPLICVRTWCTYIHTNFYLNLALDTIIDR